MGSHRKSNDQPFPLFSLDKTTLVKILDYLVVSLLEYDGLLGVVLNSVSKKIKNICLKLKFIMFLKYINVIILKLIFKK